MPTLGPIILVAFRQISIDGIRLRRHSSFND
jgi:hypothetical protein